MNIFGIQAIRKSANNLIINTENAALRNVRALFAGGSGYEIVNRAQFAISGSPSDVWDHCGRVLKTTSTGASYDGWYVPDLAAGSKYYSLYDVSAPPITLFIYGNGAGIGNYGGGIGRGNGSGTPAWTLGFWEGSYKGAYIELHLSGGTVATGGQSGGISIVDGKHTAVAVIDPSNYNIYVDGTLAETGSTPSGTFYYETGDQYRCLNFGSGYAFGGGTFAIAGMCEGAWTDSQARQFHLDPFLFCFAKAPVFRLAASAGSPPASTIFRSPTNLLGTRKGHRIV